ncbi:cilia- and flagella-associated protein 68-like [Babylonia areolata]|uniref:cilia- and flagella-associated protein 68-like n=1 Tax=Babylonia areolata TaxID=304850 RepID=UPI003FD394E7
MSHQELIQDPAFRSMVRASGAAEVWTHSTDDVKLNQFGWRCTNKESSYGNDTLIGNWSEERFDLEKRKKAECLPSQTGHYFNSVYNGSYNTVPKSEVPEVLKNLNARHSHAHPSHQPELDHDSMKAIYNSWKSTQRADYLDPSIRKQPVDVAK